MQEPGFWARLGQVWRNTRTRVIAFSVPVIAITTIGLGMSGYAGCPHAPHWSDQFYRALQLFALTDHTDCGASPQLHVARMLAAALLFLAVIRIFFKPFWTTVRLTSQAMFSPSNRVILIGYGALNQEIAREYARLGKRMTIVSRDFDGAAQDFAAKNPVVLIERDIREGGAMKGLWIGRAEKIIVACGDDSLSYEVARRIGQCYTAECRPGTAIARDVVHAHFTSVELYRQVTRSRDLGLGDERLFSGFSIREASARYLMARAWLAERAHMAQQNRLHVAIVGAGDLGLSIAREALQHGCSAHLDTPLISVIDQDGAKARNTFRAAMPRLFDGTIPAGDDPQIQFLDCTAEGMELNGQTGTGLNGVAATPVPEDAKIIDAPITAWVICCPDDGQNLTLAMKLESAMRRGLLSPAPIFPRQWQANIRDDETRGLGQADPLHLVAPFGGMDDVVGTLPFFDNRLTEIAQSIHETYRVTADQAKKTSPFFAQIEDHGPPPWRDGEGPEDPDLRAKIETAYQLDRKRFAKDWGKLSDEGRLSNMAPALQSAVRLWDLGFDWPGRYAGAIPRVKSKDIANLVSKRAVETLKTEGQLAAAAKAEHRRWMIERALRGWARAKTDKRSNALRLHPDFRRFEELAETREKENGIDRRIYDAAVVRGTLLALQAFEDAPVATAGAGIETVWLTTDQPVPENTARLILKLPDPPKKEDTETREDFAAREHAFEASLKGGRGHIRKWARRKEAVAICLRPESAESLDFANTRLRTSLHCLHQVALNHGVHMWLEAVDASGLRTEVKDQVSVPKT